jgi:tRNA pseudouridine55 synthase
VSRPRKDRRAVNGWLILDKPIGMTSTQAVAVAKRLYNARKAGHAGTLDPLASGLLPIAFGEATKTVPYVMDGEKAYRFTVQWGVETNSDDADGVAVATSDQRPARAEIEAILPGFVGAIQQVPPQFSALKIDGERAYDLARDGEEVHLEARQVEIHSLHLVSAEGDEATFEAACGKGTYVRALARDFGRLLGCYGHVVALRRMRVGGFDEAAAVSLAALEAAAADGPLAPALAELLLPIETALTDLPEVQVAQSDATRLLNGQAVLLRGRDAPIGGGTVFVSHKGRPIAIAEIDQGALQPRRAFVLD